MMTKNLIPSVLLWFFLWVAPTLAWGWGKTGHCLVGSVAAQILGHQGSEMFERHRFDLCYYNNVPDVIWKSPKTYQLERGEHFFDLEPVLEELKKKEQKLTDLPTDRSKVSQEILKQGSAPWRVHELDQRLKDLAKLLTGDSKDHQKWQGEWLVVAGVLGHYVADLAQPLHCTINYDGQLTEQKGLHNYFESLAMDQLHPKVEARVLKKALSDWPKFYKANASKSAFELSLSLCQNSLERVPEVLKLDKVVGRKDPAKYARRAARLLEERLVLGALHLAAIWKNAADWSYKGEKFFYFEGAPEHLKPGPLKKPK